MRRGYWESVYGNMKLIFYKYSYELKKKLKEQNKNIWLNKLYYYLILIIKKI